MPSSVSGAASPTGALMSFARLVRMLNAAAPAQAKRLPRVSRRVTVLRVTRLSARELRSAADDRALNLDVLDLRGVYRMRILGQHDEVGKLAARDRSFDRFLTRRIGAVQRVDAQRLVNGDALIGAPDFAIPACARHHALDTHQRREGTGIEI